MRHTITLVSLLFLLTACSSIKRNQKFLASGNYNQAIELAVKKLQKDKTGKKSAAHIALLEEAYNKVVAKDTRRISFLKEESNAANSREIYDLYRNLEWRQQLIRPLLPLGNANFVLEDYSQDIILSKNNYADYLHTEGTRLLNKNNILDAREAHHYFTHLKNLQPDYFNVDTLTEEAHYNGTDFIYVNLTNRSGQIIPQRLERELLDFNTYNLDDFWTVYHNNRENNTDYSFGINLYFREIAISPERINEKEYQRKKRVKDGWEYQLDRNGNVMKDSLGNDIKVDVYKVVTARVTVTEQLKSARVAGEVIYRDLERNKDIDRHPLTSEFIFENVFARFRGDERALTDEDKELLEFDFIPFPVNEQLVFDAGEDIKARLASILKNNSFR